METTDAQEVTAVASELAPPVFSGSEVLDETHRFLTRFAVFPSSHAAVAVTLWAAHTHVFQAFDVTPRLALLSDESRSGKTRVLDLLSLLAAKPEFVADLTGPTLFTLIKESAPTILLDETDNMFGPNGNSGKRQVLTILNVGYRQGAKIPRMSKGTIERYPAFAPAAFAGIGRLPETLQSRCVVVRMRRRRKGESCEPYMPRYHGPLGAAVGDALGAWAQSVAAELATSWPDIPEGVEDRAAEIWGPLLAIADQAGADWPRKAREACVALVLGNGTGDENAQPPALQLLADLARVWPAEADTMPTAEVVRLLQEIPGSPWANWPPVAAPREMAALLRPHGIMPVKIRKGLQTMQGYRRPAQIPANHRQEVAV